jgi:CRP/FNR family transcriptional regulator, anaerobic regulatory protein
MFMASHPDRVMTLSPCVLERIGYQELHAAFNGDRNVADRCIWQVLEEERRLHSWVFGLGQGSAEERLALLLSDFRGRLITSRVIDRDATHFDMPLTQSQIADHLGITPVHVNRVLKQLREQEIATVRNGTVAIHSTVKLKQLAGPLLDDYERQSAAYGAKPPGDRHDPER